MLKCLLYTSVDLIQYTFPLVFHTRICDVAYKGIIMAKHKSQHKSLQELNRSGELTIRPALVRNEAPALSETVLDCFGGSPSVCGFLVI